MEYCDQTKSRDLRWLLALGAAAGTFLLIFVPSDRWLNGGAAPGNALTAALLKLLLTVVLLTIVPALWARLAQRVSPWTLVFLSGLAYGSGVLLSGDAISALYAAALVVLPGLGLYALHRMRLSNFRTVIYESFLILAGMFVCACLSDLIREGDAYRSAKQILALYEETLAGLNLEFAEIGGSELLSTAQELVRMLKLSAEMIAVPMMLSAAMVAGLSNTLFSHLLNRRGGAVLTELPRFEDWRCERWYVVLIVAFSLVTFLLRLFGLKDAEALSAVADVLWRMPCALAGLCTVRSLAVRTHKGWIFWIAFAMLFTLTPIALLLLTVVGMLASLRSKSKVGEDGLQK